MKLLEIITVTIILINAKAAAQQEIKSHCGRRLVHSKALIKNGHASNEGDWPWHAAIYHIGVNLNIAFKCGGTVLNSNSILTASHCVHENDKQLIAERIIVNLGQHNLKILGRNTQQFEVYSVIPHPNYNSYDYSNDIAILRLSTEATFNNYVQPVCLWDSNKVELSEVAGKYGIVIGFGVTENDTISHVLRQVSIPVIPTLTCLQSNRALFGNFLWEKNYCAGFKNGTRVCEGDSGGSMTFEENGVFRIRGIVSLSLSTENKELCDSKDYVIFTDVARYLGWIEEVVQQVQLSTSIGVNRGVVNVKSTTGDNNVFIPSKIDTPLGTPNARISVRKCNDYKEFAYDNVTYVNRVEPLVSILKKESNCAFKVTYGASEANEREFPHQARIIATRYNTFYWSCVGSLISEQFVLSTAYCCSYTKYFDRFVRLGDYNKGRTYDPSRIDVNIIESIIHPEYKYGTGIWYNDIGLFKMERRVDFSSAIRPICLPSQSAVTSNRTITSAWAAYQLGGIESDVLLKATLDVVPQIECNNIWGVFWNLSKGIVEEKQLCAGTYEDRVRFCEGYIGAPLQIYHQTHFCTYTIVGVHNFGSYRCPDIERPNVYTRVYAYLNWIEGIVWPNEVEKR